MSWVAASAHTRGWEWLGRAGLRAESSWRVARDDGAKHLPDLGIVHKGTRTAVEVELHRKPPDRLRTILRGYTRMIDRGELTAVMYVVGRNDLEARIKRQAAAASLGTRIHIGTLASVIAGSRPAADTTSHDPQLTRETATLDDQMPLF